MPRDKRPRGLPDSPGEWPLFLREVRDALWKAEKRRDELKIENQELRAARDQARQQVKGLSKVVKRLGSERDHAEYALAAERLAGERLKLALDEARSDLASLRRHIAQVAAQLPPGITRDALRALEGDGDAP